MTVSAALALAAELINLAGNAYLENRDEIRLEDIGRRSDQALSELDNYLKSRDA